MYRELYYPNKSRNAEFTRLHAKAVSRAFRETFFQMPEIINSFVVVADVVRCPAVSNVISI